MSPRENGLVYVKCTLQESNADSIPKRPLGTLPAANGLNLVGAIKAVSSLALPINAGGICDCL
jgi:hypothetical protein